MGAQCSDCVARAREVRMLPQPSSVTSHTSDGRRTLIERHAGEKPSDHYDLDGKCVGEGGFGFVRQATSKRTGMVCALKTVFKARANLKVLKNEVEINLSLDHPNIIRMFDVYEDRRQVYMVFELCHGGEVLEKILEMRRFSEKDAVHILAQLLWAVNYLHKKCIAHRDLKLENLLLKEPVADMQHAKVKVIDFGMAKSFPAGRASMFTVAGSAFYVAPEVLIEKERNFGYNEKCDIWSAGVIFYMLLSGTPPYSGEMEAQILDNVRHAALQLSDSSWRQISPEAKQLVRRMIRRDVHRRMDSEAAQAACKLMVDCRARERTEEMAMTTAMSTASDCSTCGCTPRSAGDPLPADFCTRLRAFGARSRFVKVARHLMARRVEDPEHVREMSEFFRQLDTNGDGSISLEEAKAGFAASGMSDVECLDEVFGDIDTDNNRQIDYTEFMAALMDRSHTQNEELCWEAFRVFDADKDGQIGVRDLQKTLLGASPAGGTAKAPPALSLQEAEALLREADADGDGKVSFAEFVTMMRQAETPLAGRMNSSKMFPLSYSPLATLKGEDLPEDE